MNRTRLIAYGFIFMLVLTATAFVQVEPVTATGSETRIVYLYPTGAPTYTYGTSTSGGYSNLVSPDGTPHVSTSASYLIAQTPQGKYVGTGADNPGWYTIPWANPTQIQGTENGVYATATGDESGVQKYSHGIDGYNCGFTIADGNTITGIQLQIYVRKAGGVGQSINDYNIQFWKGSPRTWGTEMSSGGIWSTSWTWRYYGGINTMFGLSLTPAEVRSSNFGAFVSVALSGGSPPPIAQMDSMYIAVFYSATYYRIDYYYNFQFTDSAKAQITQIEVGVTASSSPSTQAWVYEWNWTTSTWDYIAITGMSHLFTGYVQTTIDYAPYIRMDSTGHFKLRFLGYDLSSSSYTFSIDWAYLKVTYTELAPSTPTLTSPADGIFISTSSVNLTWSGTDTYFSKYQLQTATNDAFTQNLSTYNQTTAYRVWDLSAQVNGTYYWRVRIVNTYEDVSNWASRSFVIADPLVSVIFRDANNAALNDIINPAAFNTTYRRSIQDPAGTWHTLSPYFPIISVYSNEHINITVRDWLGNYLVNNQQYDYAPAIVLNLDIYDVCVGNGADAMAYIILRSGAIVLHKFTFRSDVHWLVIPGNYNLTIIYPDVGNIQVYYNLTITGDYGIKISSDAIADLYSAVDNWDLLTTNVGNIVTKINGVWNEIYEVGDTQIQVKERIEATNWNMGNISENQNILNWIIIAFAAAVVIALAAIWVRSGERKAVKDFDHFREPTSSVDSQTVSITLAEIKKKEKGG